MEQSEPWGHVVREECIHHSLLHQLELWRRIGLIAEIGAVSIERRRGVVVTWRCALADHDQAAPVLLIEVQDFARRACAEFGLPEATIWWIGEEDETQVRLAFSPLPFDA